jgi:hypothetical protein
LGCIYCGWFIILWPVRHGHSPPICRYGETFIDARKRLRDLIVNTTTRVSRLDGLCDPKSRLIARRNARDMTAITQYPITPADIWDTALGLPLVQHTCISVKGRGISIVCVTDLKRCWVIVPFVDHGGVTCDGSERGNMSHSRRVYYIKPRLVNICFQEPRA